MHSSVLEIAKMSFYVVSFFEEFPQNNSSGSSNSNFSDDSGYSFIRQNSDVENGTIFMTTSSSQGRSHVIAPSLQQNSRDPDNTELLKFIIWGILGSCLAVLGFLGNTLSIAVLYRPQMRSSTSYYLISLAIYDNGILLGMMVYFCLPSLASYTNFQAHYQSASSQTIIIGYPLSLAAQMGSIYTCVAFTVERYIAVCWPLHAANTCTKSRTVRAMVFILLWSLAYNIPRFFHYEIDYLTETTASVKNSATNGFDVENNSLNGVICKDIQSQINSTDNCTLYTSVHHVTINITDSHRAQTISEFLSSLANTTLWPETSRSLRAKRVATYKETEFGSGYTFKHVYLIYSQLFFMFLLPFLVILFMNMGLIQAVRSSQCIQQSMCPSARKEHNLTVMLIAVIVVFLICQFPTIIDNILVAVMGEHERQASYSYMCFWIACTFMVEINAASNFLLYCFFGKKFRMMLLTMLGIKGNCSHMTYRSNICRYQATGSRTYNMEVSAV